jgi:hypothetical protein
MNLLGYVLLSLYVLLPPRRNQDYQDLYVVKKWKADLSKDKNYYDSTAHKFIFNKYKTSKAHGVQTVDISENKPLVDIINLYLNVLNAGVDLLLRLVFGLSLLNLVYQYHFDINWHPFIYWAVLLLAEDFLFWLA